MKRIFFALAACALLLTAAAPQAEARGEVSIDFFYENLGDDGSWVEVADYGYAWQPNIAVSNRDWRPYSDGYWAYTDVGWTWVSYESFGWATYHYGNWARVRGHGWLWVPGREWGPAWVSWRTGGDYVGWAPLPPRRRYSGGGAEIVYEGRPIGGQVDIEFDIGPDYYNFVDIRYIGAPVLREHIYQPTQNITYINSTVNVTNITYNNSVVYNGGPDYDRLSRYSTRPIQRLTLQRQTDVDLQNAVQSGSLTRVQGNQLVVAAPAVFQAPTQPIAPKNIRTRIAKPDLETGWMGISDPKAKAELQEKMKKEDSKSVPPPQIAPANAPGAQASPPAPAPSPSGATPPTPNTLPAGASAPTTPEATPADPKERGKGRNRRALEPPIQGTPSAQPSAPFADEQPSPIAPVADPKQRGKGNRPSVQPRRPNESEPIRDMDPAAAAAPPTLATQPPKEKGKANRAAERDPLIQSDAAVPQPQAEPARERGPKNKDRRGGQDAPPMQAPAPVDAAPAVEPPQGDNNRERGPKNKDRRERQDAPPVQAPAPADAPPAVQPPAADNNRERGPKNKDRRGAPDFPPVQAPPPIDAPPAIQPPIGDNGRGRGKPKKDEMRGPAADIAPPPQAAPREEPRMRQERPAPPPQQQIAPPPSAPAPAPNAPPPERGKPEKREKKKKGDDGPPEE